MEGNSTIEERGECFEMKVLDRVEDWGRLRNLIAIRNFTSLTALAL